MPGATQGGRKGKSVTEKGVKRGKGGKAKAGQGTRLGLLAAADLESLELIGPDGEVERLTPNFCADTFYYRNQLPFDLDLTQVTVRATARELQSHVSLARWVLDPPLDVRDTGADANATARAGEGVGSSKSTLKAAAGGREKGRGDKGGNAAARGPKGKGTKGKQAGKGKGGNSAMHAKGPGKAAGDRTGLAAPHVLAQLGRASLSVGDIEEGATGSSSILLGGSTSVIAPERPPVDHTAITMLPAYILTSLRAEMHRIYDTIRPHAADPASRITADEWYETLHGLRLGISRRDADELFKMADARAAGSVSHADLSRVLRACKPSCAEAVIAVDADASAKLRLEAPAPGQGQRHSVDHADGAGGADAHAVRAWAQAEGAEGVPAMASPLPLADTVESRESKPLEPQTFSMLVRVTVTAPDGSVQTNYAVQVYCEPPAPAPPMPPDLAPIMRSLFDYHATYPPRSWLQAQGLRLLTKPGLRDKTVNLEAFVSCVRTLHLTADAGAARAAFLFANRHKKGARVALGGFWTAMFFTYVCAHAVAAGSWDHDVSVVMEALRAAVLPLEWTTRACQTVERNRMATARARDHERAWREDQGRAHLEGNRWAFAAFKGHSRPDDRRESTDVDVRDIAEARGALEDLPVDVNIDSEPAKAYMHHIAQVWRDQQHAPLWPA